jgi:YHS domain-containing protein
MKSRWMIMSLFVAALVAVSGLKAAKEEAKKEFKATCPVAGKPAGESHVKELKNGDKVYFCCDNCPKEFAKNPKKYTLQVNRQLVETGQVVQVACPITGKSVSKDHMVEAGMTKVGLCCEKCEAAYTKANDEEKLKMLFAKAAFDKGFTHQTMCPVSGKPIDPSHSVEYKGKKVYFCCPNCPAAFEKDPEKYVDKLPQLKEKPAKKAKKAA